MAIERVDTPNASPGDDVDRGRPSAPGRRGMLGDDLPVRIEFWDGSVIRAGRAVGTLRFGQPDAVRRHAVEPERARAGPGLRRRRAGRRRRHLRGRRGAAPRRLARACGLGWSALPARRRRGRAGWTARAAAAAAAGGGPPARRAALAAARRRGHRPPLRRRQRLLPDRARAVDDLLVRPLRRRRTPTSPRRRPPSTS